MPGASLGDITDAVEDMTKDATNNTLYVIHAGTNDVQRTRSEELLQKYREMIRRYKTKSANIIISGILPRINADARFYNLAFSTNNRLRNLCQQENVEFLNMWNDFYNEHNLFQRDGLHLNGVGAARMGRLIHEKVCLHRSKNAQVTTPATAS